jgi:hypothetical protein
VVKIVEEFWRYVRDVIQAWQVAVSGAWILFTALRAVLGALGRHVPKWAARSARVFDVVFVLIVLFAPFGVWRKQRLELRSSRDSTAMWIRQADSCLGGRERGEALTDAIISRLGRFIAEGDVIKKKCFTNVDALPDFERWNDAIVKYLRARAPDPGFAIRFLHPQVDMSHVFDGMRVEDGNIWNSVDARQAVLNDFIRELQADKRR